MGLFAEFSVLKTKTAFAVGEIVVEGVVVDIGAVVVSIQLNSSQGQPPRQFC